MLEIEFLNVYRNNRYVWKLNGIYEIHKKICITIDSPLGKAWNYGLVITNQ